MKPTLRSSPAKRRKPVLRSDVVAQMKAQQVRLPTRPTHDFTSHPPATRPCAVIEPRRKQPVSEYNLRPPPYTLTSCTVVPFVQFKRIVPKELLLEKPPPNTSRYVAEGIGLGLYCLSVAACTVEARLSLQCTKTRHASAYVEKRHLGTLVLLYNGRHPGFGARCRRFEPSASRTTRTWN